MINLNLIFEFSFIIGLISFILISGHFLTILISLEFIIIRLYFFIGLYSIFQFYSLDFLFLYLTIMIIEGVFGLCILIYLSRFNGTDLYKLD